MIFYIIAIILGYLIGAIPIGLVIARIIKKVDIRQHGSGKIGTTNVLRTVGRPAAVLVLSLDICKTITAVIIIRMISGPLEAELLAALSVMAGHNWPIFTGFKGGRGTAPGLGGLIIFSPWSAIAACIGGLPTILISKYVSLGSILGTLAGGLTLFILGLVGVIPIQYGIYGIAGGVTIITSHKDNIVRIYSGTERRFGSSI